MSRSVTRAVLIVGGPLVVLATISILGSRPAHPIAARPLAGAHLATHGSLQTGINALGQMALRVTPPSTPAPTAVPAARAPGAPPPTPTAAPPAPPVSGVARAAGAAVSLVKQDPAPNGVAPPSHNTALARVAHYPAPG